MVKIKEYLIPVAGLGIGIVVLCVIRSWIKMLRNKEGGGYTMSASSKQRQILAWNLRRGFLGFGFSANDKYLLDFAEKFGIINKKEWSKLQNFIKMYTFDDDDREV